jgi:mRNA-degrading endonuclease RelE of RelBE toxin-antitoxin system
MFQVKFTSEATDDLHQMRKFDQVKVAQAIRSQLTDQPNQPTPNRKRLQPNPLAEWELRVDPFRVFYDVDVRTNQVSIVAIGRKQRNKLFVHGREFKL